MHYLTKTTFIHARQCHKRYWLARFAPHYQEPVNEIQTETIRQGQAVGRAARAFFPGGVLIDEHGEAALEQTRIALASAAPAVFEATFLHDGILVRCDILVRNGNNTWTLVEVKSSAHIRDHYLYDIAIQAHVATQSGLPLARLEIMHINTKSCVYPHLEELFVRVDVTKRVHALLSELPRTLAEIRTLSEQPETPKLAIGPHCTAPHPCPFKGHCWRDVPPASIFTIPRLAREKLEQLIGQGIYSLLDIPPDFELTANQRRYVEFIRQGTPRIDRAGIRQALRELTFPLYFFDFETYSPAIPTLEGMRPYQNYPFQYSCHVLHADGRMEHHEYLHDQDDDPRPALTAQLIQDLGRTGTIIAYNAQFERSVLRGLAAALPRHAIALEQIQLRLWDQLAPMRRYYDHPRFLNSKSIKRVLPVLVPELSYADLTVQRGDAAQVVWQQMLAETDPQRRAELADGLRAYCERDTFAMVKIHEVLTSV